jgi:hypothetical protein
MDACYQVSIHLAKWLQRRVLEIDQSETGITCGGHVCYTNWDDMRNVLEELA